MYHLMAFINGIIFGAGLTISNMMNPYKVLNFLDVTGNWDPTLLVVMVAALLTTFIGYRIVRLFRKPVLGERFHIPEKTKITKRFILGSVIFGIGWGIAGYCPGPSITALATWNMDPLYFVISMVMGSYAYYWFYIRNKRE
ncbi:MULTISPECIES: DUF6691 family protein [unclassified Legionella]|uniref:DUF6691 family protein n=1 Tax=unclassified Legionella TaxID=2622702 RepID=UPI001055DD5B|nr:MULTISPECIES: DUF6691 family protein [unclassified Legionella]MDI9817856.1 transporter [Legionella sp. PL877]